MPEGIEIEYYRRSAETVVGRVISEVSAPDAYFLKDGASPRAVADAANGQRVVAARRRGKLLVLDLANDVRLGLRFGMTGRLLVDGTASIERLEYSSARNDPAWDRFVLRFVGGGELRIRDPRRLGGVSLDPHEGDLGPDVFVITPAELRRRVLIGDVALKARLLDQRRVAGIGNLLADEMLWRAGIDPARPAGGLTDAEQRRLIRRIREVLADCLERGGSHTGDLFVARERGGRCPRDGAPLLRREIGGRTTYSCTRHQR